MLMVQLKNDLDLASSTFRLHSRTTVCPLHSHSDLDHSRALLLVLQCSTVVVPGLHLCLCTIPTRTACRRLVCWRF